MYMYVYLCVCVCVRACVRVCKYVLYVAPMIVLVSTCVVHLQDLQPKPNVPPNCNITLD